MEFNRLTVHLYVIQLMRIYFIPKVSPMTNTTGICKLPTATPDTNGGHAGEVIQLLDW